MQLVRQVRALLAAVLLTLAAVSVSDAQSVPTTFVAMLSTAEEVPQCPSTDGAARGLASFSVLDQATGVVRYRLVANNLPGVPSTAHIHVAPPGVAGPIVQPLSFTLGAAEHGIIGLGTFTNPVLLAALQANPQNYYVNVHSSVCPAGVIRGQLGEQELQGSMAP